MTFSDGLNVGGYMLHQLLWAAAMPLIAGSLWTRVMGAQAPWRTGRALWTMCGWWLWVFFKMLDDMSYTRLVILAGGIGMYQIAYVLPARWTERGLRLAGLTAIGVAVVNGMTDANRMGLFLNQNQSAALVLLLAPWAGAWMGGGFGLLITGSRGALLGAITALAAARLPRRAWLAALAIAPLLIVGLIWIRPETVTYRLGEWRTALNLYMQSPIDGAGVGALRVAGGGEHADSLPITMLAETGLIGLIGMAAVWFKAAAIAVESSHPARWGLLAWSVVELTDATMLWPWAGLAAAASLAALERSLDA